MKPNLTNKTTPHCSGFTLIELLVVIAMIAALATLGFMGMRKAMDNAAKAKSIANMKQLVSANHLFSADYNGAIMHAADTVVNGIKRNWSEHLLVTLNPELANNDDYSKPVGDSVARSMGIFADSKALKAGKSALPETGHNSWRTYAYNNRIGVASLDNPGSKPWITGARFPYQVEKPHKFILFGQKILQGNLYNQALQFHDANDGTVDFTTYKGYTPVGYFDGHVEMVSKKDYPATAANFPNGQWNLIWWGISTTLPPP